MKDIINEIVKERDVYRNHLEEALDLLNEIKNRYDLNETDSEYIQELIEREEENKKDLEIDLDEETYGYIMEISKYCGIRREEVIEKILSLELNQRE